MGCWKKLSTCASRPEAAGSVTVDLREQTRGRRIGERRPPVQLPRRGIDRPDLAEAAGDGPPHDHDGRGQPAEHDAELHHVVPDHRLDAAEHRVGRHQHADDDRHGVEVDLARGRRVDREAGHIHRRGHPADAPQDEDQRRQGAHAHVKAGLEIFIDRVEVEAAIKRKRHLRDPRIEREPRRDAEDQHDAIPDRRRRLHQVVHAAVERRHQRQPDRQPPHALLGTQVLIEAGLFP
jgi:hypothetical protein